MPLYINDQETKILLGALEDCRMKQIAKGHSPEQVQDLYSKLWDAANKVKPANRTYTKRKIFNQNN